MLTKKVMIKKRLLQMENIVTITLLYLTLLGNIEMTSFEIPSKESCESWFHYNVKVEKNKKLERKKEFQRQKKQAQKDRLNKLKEEKRLIKLQQKLLILQKWLHKFDSDVLRHHFRKIIHPNQNSLAFL